MKKIFITGSSGFVGKSLKKELTKRNIPFYAGVRLAKNANEVSYGDITTQQNWCGLLEDVNVVIHLAARVHVMNEVAENPIELFRKVNCEASVNLAKAAKEVGVKRFIFLSSIKVNGEQTTTPFQASDKPMPEDPYGISKMEAEEALMKLHEPGVFDVVIIRPPLIYGAGVKANFEKLFQLVQKGVPMPFGMVKNKRSMVSVYNLNDLIINCCDNPQAGGNIFLVSDDNDLSLPELIQRMAESKNKSALLLPVPVALMKLAFALIGKSSVSTRLFGNLQVDINKTKKVLGWKPPYTFLETFSESNN